MVSKPPSASLRQPCAGCAQEIARLRKPCCSPHDLADPARQREPTVAEFAPREAGSLSALKAKPPNNGARNLARWDAARRALETRGPVTGHGAPPTGRFPTPRCDAQHRSPHSRCLRAGCSRRSSCREPSRRETPSAAPTAPATVTTPTTSRPVRSSSEAAMNSRMTIVRPLPRYQRTPWPPALLPQGNPRLTARRLALGGGGLPRKSHGHKAVCGDRGCNHDARGSRSRPRLERVKWSVLLMLSGDLNREVCPERAKKPAQKNLSAGPIERRIRRGDTAVTKTQGQAISGRLPYQVS